MKTYRFDGSATCGVTLWIPAETQEQAEAILAGSPSESLIRVTSLNHVRPDKSTMIIYSVRESTGENP